MRHNPGCGIMAGLMRQRRRPISAGRELVDRRHRDAVGDPIIEGAIAPDMQGGGESVDERLRTIREDISRWHDAERGRPKPLREIIDLVPIEDRVAAQDVPLFIGRCAGCRRLDRLRV
jgi:hypothetical protein